MTATVRVKADYLASLVDFALQDADDLCRLRIAELKARHARLSWWRRFLWGDPLNEVAQIKRRETFVYGTAFALCRAPGLLRACELPTLSTDGYVTVDAAVLEEMDDMRKYAAVQRRKAAP